MATPDLQLVASLLRQRLEAGEIAPLVVTSGSMRPLIRAGDRIGLGALSSDGVQIGEIYTFFDGETLTTHRLMEIDGNGRWQLRGDRLWQRDQPQPPEHVIGRVVWVERAGERVDLESGNGRWLNQKLFDLVRWRESRSPSLYSPPPQPRRLLLHWSELWGAWQVWWGLRR